MGGEGGSLLIILWFYGTGYQVLSGDGLVMGLSTRGPSVLLYAHMPQGEFIK